MSFLKKTWAFLKTHWYFPILMVGLIFASVIALAGRGGGVDNLISMFEGAREKYEKEVELIEKNQHLKELEKKQNKEKYEHAITEIEKKIKIKRNELNKSQKKKVKQLLEKHGDNYDSMVEEMADEFGFEVK